MPTHEDTIIAEWLDAHGHGELAWEWQFPSDEFSNGKKPNDFTQPAPLLAAILTGDIGVGCAATLPEALRNALAAAIEAEKEVGK